LLFALLLVLPVQKFGHRVGADKRSAFFLVSRGNAGVPNVQLGVSGSGQ
jgi:hypothetical protein